MIDFLGRGSTMSRDTDDEIFDIVRRDMSKKGPQYSARHRRNHPPTPSSYREESQPQMTGPRSDATSSALEPDQRSVAFWDGVGIEPVELDLPSGVGFTLRHLVPSSEPDEPPQPIFLGHQGTIKIFRSSYGLHRFLRSSVPHDLSETEYWWAVTDALDLDFTPQQLNRYELDLVVDIVRAGYEAWGRQQQATVLLAGELARDIAGYTQDDDLLDIFTPGSALDRLDDDLRTDDRGAVRRMRRNNYYQLALSWRRAIGIISTHVQWHE